MTSRFLTALPVYNEVAYVSDVLDQVARFSADVLVVDDGSTDGTAELLAKRSDIRLVTHSENRGYGAALMTAFEYAVDETFDIVVTIDCDGQHEPQRIPSFVEACERADVVSGSRYLRQFEDGNQPPAERRHINQLITAELNQRLSLNITDAFCGFKAYRTPALQKIRLTETGYAMPLELWAQVAAAELRVWEIPVPLIYLDEKRSFGGVLDEADVRLEYYRLVLDRSISSQRVQHPNRHTGPLCGERNG